MKAKFFVTIIFLVLVPGTASADRPALTSVKKQVVLLTKMVQRMSQELADTRLQLTATQAELAAIKNNTVLGLDGLLTLTQDPNGFATVRLSGVNLQVVNGEGVTDSINGLGNVVIGYNTSNEAFVDRQGSHNIILGDDQAYPDTAGVVTGNMLSNRDLAVITAGNMSVLVGADQSTTVGSNRSISVGGNKTETIGANESISIGASQTITVGSNKTENIGGNESIAVGSDKTESINGASSLVVDKDVSMNFASNLSTNIGKEMEVVAGDEIFINTGNASASMKKDGTIIIEGKDITIKGSGDINVKAAKDVIIKGSKILEN
jgi:hypothetical protein